VMDTSLNRVVSVRISRTKGLHAMASHLSIIYIEKNNRLRLMA
jgi:hypothetical protein